MKMIGTVIDLMDCRHQTSLLICVILVIVFPILAATDVDKHEYGNAYERKTEGTQAFSKNTKQLKHSDDNGDSALKHTEDRGRVNNENGSPLNRFLEDVLKAQDDLKWIDQVVHSTDRQKHWDSFTGSNKYPGMPNFDATSSQGGKKVRDKRSFLWKTNRKKSHDQDPSGSPQRVYLDSDMPFEKSQDPDYEDASQNGINGKEDREYKSNKLLNEKDATGDQLPKDWSNTKDICSLNDWLNSNKNFKTEQDKRDYGSDQGNPLNPLKTDSRVNVRNQRDEMKKEESPSLESLKETILELKKSLNEDEKKERQVKVKEKGDVKERNTRGKNKHRKHEKNTDSSWWDTSEPEASDVKKREQDPEDLNDKNADRKAWRRKRTEDNNEDDSPKLFHRAGFGESYLEEEALKELHDRKRRSKGILSDEKHCLDGSCDKNNLQTEKDPGKISKQTDCNDLDDSNKKESNDLQPADAFQRSSKPINSFEDTSNYVRKSKNMDLVGNYDRGNQMENKLMKDNEEKGDPLDIFGSMTNELHPASGRTSALSTDDSDKVEEARMQQGKVFQPEDSDRAKPCQQLPQEKRSPKDSDNINILVKSENKNVIKFSNSGTDENSRFKGERPYVLNRFDMKKKVFVENEDKRGKSVATVFNVKIEKAQVDSPAKGNNKREGMGREEQIPFASPNFGKDKADELYESKHDLTNDINQRNVDEKGINFVEINKGSTESSDKEGTQNWYKNHQLNINDQNAVEKDQFEKKEEKLNDNKMKEYSIDGTTSSSSNVEDKSVDPEEKNKKKYTQIVIVPEGLDDRKLSDMYSQRRILQYMEYSNDDVEDADASYSDKEDENQRQAEKSSASLKRKARAALRDKGKAKVNVLIKEKLDKRKKYSRDSTRKRRNPVSVIEYYDYDSDNEQREHETGEQERLKTSYDKNPIESDAGLEKLQIKHTCLPPAAKKDEQEEAVLKLEKLKNKQPKQEFIVHDSESHPKNVTEKTGEQKSFESLSTREEGSSLKRPQEQSGRLSQSIAEREDKFLGGGSKDPVTYIFNAEKDLDPEMIDDFLEDIQSMDGKNEKTSNNFEPLYEELKKIYDWNQDELQNKPRIKGDHRMYYGANDKLDPTNKMSESFTGQIEVPETQASSPNLLPLLLVYNGSGRSVAGLKTCSTESSDHPASRSSSNVSQSNYFALKSTDDMFKGGSEQSNSTEVKLREPSSIGTLVEWRGQKVSGVSNEPAPEKDAGSWSLTERRQYIDTDSRSPYENRKYLESRLPRERVQNIDREKQTVISSGDLHESFVEPLDWIDDFDEDTRLRLSRSLKTIDRDNLELSDKIAQDGADLITKVKDGEKRTSTLITEQSLLNVSTEISKIHDSTMKTTSKLEDSQLDLLRYPSLDLLELFNKNTDRTKRQASLPYDTFYDDTNQPQADSEKLDYYGYPKKGDRMNNPVQSLISKSDEGMERYDTMEDENYGKVARRASSKKKKHKKRKKQYSDQLKKRKKKDHTKKSKYSGTSRRKRRHPKKHSNASKKDHEHDRNKHKKRVSKTANHRSNGKKSKIDGNVHNSHQEPSINERKTRREKMYNEHAINADSDRQKKKISSLLTIDNVEDESQMDSALHGELAGKIVEHIFDQVQKNEDLKVSLGPGLYHKHKTRDTVSSDKTYRQALSDDEINHTTELLNKIMLLLNRLIFDEVQRKTCVSLSPDLTEFLDWMLDVNPRHSVEQLPSLPLVHAVDVPTHFPKDKFLFHGSPSNEKEAEFTELREKLQLIEKLINEYRTLSEKEKTKVQSVHDYLSKQLDLLIEYVEENEKERSATIGAAKGGSGMIVQYQGGMTNISNYGRSKGPNMVSMNVSDLWKLNNARFLADEEYFPEDGLDFFHKGRRTIRSLDRHSKGGKKHRKRGKSKKKHRKRHKGGNAIDQPPHKDTEHKAIAVRQKREYLDKEFQDSFDSEYEEPLIYSSMDFENAESKKRDDEAKASLGDENDRNTLIEDVVEKKLTNQNMETSTEIERDTSTASINLQLSKSSTIDQKQQSDPVLGEEEPITGKDELEDEIILLNKRQSWKKQNEEQLEEVAFGEDMRKGLMEKELFEKLTEIDKKKSSAENARTKRNDENNRNGNYNLSDEDKLRMLEEKINVYSDNG